MLMRLTKGLWKVLKVLGRVLWIIIEGIVEGFGLIFGGLT